MEGGLNDQKRNNKNSKNQFSNQMEFGSYDIEQYTAANPFSSKTLDNSRAIEEMTEEEKAK